LSINGSLHSSLSNVSWSLSRHVTVQNDSRVACLSWSYEPFLSNRRSGLLSAFNDGSLVAWRPYDDDLELLDDSLSPSTKFHIGSSSTNSECTSVDANSLKESANNSYLLQPPLAGAWKSVVIGRAPGVPKLIEFSTDGRYFATLSESNGMSTARTSTVLVWFRDLPNFSCGKDPIGMVHYYFYKEYNLVFLRYGTRGEMGACRLVASIARYFFQLASLQSLFAASTATITLPVGHNNVPSAVVTTTETHATGPVDACLPARFTYPLPPTLLHHPVLHQLLELWLLDPFSDAQVNIEFARSNASNCNDRLAPSHRSYPSFAFATSLALENPSNPNAELSGSSGQFVVHWLNNKMYRFDERMKSLLLDSVARSFAIPMDGVSSLPADSSQMASLADHLGLFDQSLATLLGEWQHAPDVVLSIHPADGSLIVWYVHGLDMSVSNPAGIRTQYTPLLQDGLRRMHLESAFTVTPNLGCKLTHVTTSLRSRLHEAFPSGEAASVLPGIFLFLTATPKSRYSLQMLQTGCTPTSDLFASRDISTLFCRLLVLNHSLQLLSRNPTGQDISSAGQVDGRRVWKQSVLNGLSEMASLADHLGLFDQSLATLLGEWQHAPDVVLSIHPADGSLIVWYVHGLDMSVSNPAGIRTQYTPLLQDGLRRMHLESAFTVTPNLGCKLTHVTTSLRSRLHEAFPSGEAASVLPGIFLFLTATPKSRYSLQMLQTGCTPTSDLFASRDISTLFCRLLVFRNPTGQDISSAGQVDGRRVWKQSVLNGLSEAQLLWSSFDTKVHRAQYVAMVTRHVNGSLRYWRLDVSASSHFQWIVSVNGSARLSGHRFHTEAIVPHPLLPLVLTSSHYSHSSLCEAAPVESIQSTLATISSATSESHSEVILWRVGPVGPLTSTTGSLEQCSTHCHHNTDPKRQAQFTNNLSDSSNVNGGTFSEGGLFEVARIDVSEPGQSHTWFDDLAWFPCMVTTSLTPYPVALFLGNLSSLSDVPGTGQLGFFLAFADTGEDLSVSLNKAHEDRFATEPNRFASLANSDTSGCILQLRPTLPSSSRIGRTCPPGKQCAIPETLLLHVFPSELIPGTKLDQSNAQSTENRLHSTYLIVRLTRWQFAPHQASTRSESKATDSEETRLEMWRVNVIAETGFATDSGASELSSPVSLSSFDELLFGMEKLCDCELPLPEEVSMIRAEVSAAHVSWAALSTYNAPPPYLIVSACTDGCLRFWRCDVLPSSDQLGGCEWILEDTIDLTADLRHNSKIPVCVQLDWVSTEDGGHLLSIMLGSRVLVYAATCQNVTTSSAQGHPQTASTLMTSLGEVYLSWIRVATTHVHTTYVPDPATSSTESPIPISGRHRRVIWLRDGLLLVGVSAEMHVYSQWPSETTGGHVETIPIISAPHALPSSKKKTNDNVRNNNRRLSYVVFWSEWQMPLTYTLSSCIELDSRRAPKVLDIDCAYSGRVAVAYAPRGDDRLTNGHCTSALVDPTMSKVLVAVYECESSAPSDIIDSVKVTEGDVNDATVSTSASLTVARLTKTYSAYLLKPSPSSALLASPVANATALSPVIPSANKSVATNALPSGTAGGPHSTVQPTVTAPSVDAMYSSLLPNLGLFESIQLLEWMNFGRLRRIQTILAHLTRCLSALTPVSTLVGPRNSRNARATSVSNSTHQSSRRVSLVTELTGSAPPNNPASSAPSNNVGPAGGAPGGTMLEAQAIPPVPLYVLLAVDSLQAEDLVTSESEHATAFDPMDEMTPFTPTQESELFKIQEDTESLSDNEACSPFSQTDLGTHGKYRIAGHGSSTGNKVNSSCAAMSMWSLKPTSLAAISQFRPEDARLLAEHLAIRQLPGLSPLDQMYLLGIADLMANTQTDITERLSGLEPRKKKNEEDNTSMSESTKAADVRFHAQPNQDFNPGSPACRQAKLNAFRLLSQHRYMQAAGLFLLADCLDDAVRVCLDTLKDLQLAVVLARLYTTTVPVPESRSTDSPYLRLLRQHVVTNEDPFIRSMAFWTLGDPLAALQTLLEGPQPIDHTSTPNSPSNPSLKPKAPTSAISWLQINSDRLG
ncbi:hypothetical protein AHF37_04462, partial [Paragonimus kellicotti]